MMRARYACLALLVLAACEDDPAPSTVSKDPIRLSGAVSSGGEPVAGARILLGNARTYPNFEETGTLSALTSSGPGGFFSFDHVSRSAANPYTITVRDDSLGTPLVTQFIGITRGYANVFTLAGDRARKAWSCPVQLHFENLPAEASVLYVASPSIVRVRDEGSSLTLFWNGSYQQAVTLRALVYEKDPATSLPLRYLGYASQVLRVIPGQTAAWLPSVQPITTTETTIELSPADGAESSIAVDAGDGSNEHVVGRLTNAGGVVRLPRFEGVRYTLRAQRRTGAGTSNLFHRFGPADTRIQLPFPNPPVLSVSAGTDTTMPRDAVFQWDGDGVARLRLDVASFGRIDVFTLDKKVSLPHPALDILGLPIPANARIDATLVQVPQTKSMDDAVGPGGFDLAQRDTLEALPVQRTVE